MFGRRRRGIGLGGIIFIAALLYFTGAGAWMWNQLRGADRQCYSLLNQLGTAIGSPVCAGIGRAVDSVDGMIASLGETGKNAANDAWFRLSGGSDMHMLLGDMKLSNALKKYASSGQDQTNQLLIGPSMVSPYADATTRLRSALDNFAIGNRYMAGDGSASDKALPWLQTGAANPGYGLLSQLSLGDLYRTGYGNVPADPVQASRYYQQASQSIKLLQQDGSVPAQQLLKTLPSSPQHAQAQIDAVVKQLQAVKK